MTENERLIQRCETLLARAIEAETALADADRKYLDRIHELNSDYTHHMNLKDDKIIKLKKLIAEQAETVKQGNNMIQERL